MPCRWFDAVFVFLWNKTNGILGTIHFVCSKRNRYWHPKWNGKRARAMGTVNRKETDAIETFTDTLALRALAGGSTNHGKWQITNVSALFLNTHNKSNRNYLLRMHMSSKHPTTFDSEHGNRLFSEEQKRWQCFDKIPNENIHAVALSSDRFTWISTLLVNIYDFFLRCNTLDA